VTQLFERITIIGLGLLGGSVAMAARSRAVAATVVGVTRRPETLEAALRDGAVDSAGSDLAEGVRDAEFVVLATPVFAMAEVLRKAAPHLAPGALVTDIGSVKGILAESLSAILPAGVTYVGAHPMAGGHQTGFSHARGDLFEGATCIVSPTPGTPRARVERVEAFWSALGARVLERDPAAHDAEVGWVSHVPHAMAFAFAHALGASPPGAVEVQGPGFRDFTRIARSDPGLWADILVSNRQALAAPLREASQRLGALARMVEKGDAEATEQFIDAGRENLSRGANHARSGGANSEIQAVPKRTAAKESHQEV
jgi:prephenate dehydrogenase